MTDPDRYLTDERVDAATRALRRPLTPHRAYGYGDFEDAALAALSAVVPDIIRQAKEEAWDEGAHTAWERSTPEVNGARYHWRSDGEPVNPYEKGGQQ